jgi:hypothetical protein
MKAGRYVRSRAPAGPEGVVPMVGGAQVRRTSRPTKSGVEPCSRLHPTPRPIAWLYNKTVIR